MFQHELYIRAFHLLTEFPPVSILMYSFSFSFSFGLRSLYFYIMRCIPQGDEIVKSEFQFVGVITVKSAELRGFLDYKHTAFYLPPGIENLAGGI